MPEQKPQRLLLTPETLNTQFAESYRALRANINFTEIDHDLKSMVVTSAKPSEGKTTTAVNLAVVMAQAGRRVLLVDTDFRRPGLQELVGVHSNGHGRLAGLSDVIVGDAKVDTALQLTPFPNLALLPAGVRPPNPSELLGSQRMAAVMSDLTQRADLVILDTPPVLVYADALLVAAMADGVLYVLRAGPQDKSAQRRVQKQLQQAKVRVLGVVFNDVDVVESDNSYAYYYSNGSRRR